MSAITDCLEGDGDMTSSSMQGTTVAISGGTGSFGSMMAKHLRGRGVGSVLILSRDEAKRDEMRKRFSDSQPDRGQWVVSADPPLLSQRPNRNAVQVRTDG